MPHPEIFQFSTWFAGGFFVFYLAALALNSNRLMGAESYQIIGEVESSWGKISLLGNGIFFIFIMTGSFFKTVMNFSSSEWLKILPSLMLPFVISFLVITIINSLVRKELYKGKLVRMKPVNPVFFLTVNILVMLLLAGGEIYFLSFQKNNLMLGVGLLIIIALLFILRFYSRQKIKTFPPVTEGEVYEIFTEVMKENNIEGTALAEAYTESLKFDSISSMEPVINDKRLLFFKKWAKKLDDNELRAYFSIAAEREKNSYFKHYDLSRLCLSLGLLVLFAFFRNSGPLIVYWIVMFFVVYPWIRKLQMEADYRVVDKMGADTVISLLKKMGGISEGEVLDHVNRNAFFVAPVYPFLHRINLIREYVKENPKQAMEGSSVTD